MTSSKEVVQQAYDAFANGDIPAVLGMMDDKIEWNEAEGFPLYDGTYVGPQAVLENVFMRLGEIGDDFSVIPSQLVADGDTVVGLCSYNWTRPSTGDRVSVEAAHVWTVADGKLVAFRQHIDTLKVQQNTD